MKGKRLDQRLTELGLAESREKAKATIMSGLVYVNGQKSDKPGMPVGDGAEIEVRGSACPWVSRGGFKLAKALESFHIDPSGAVCIDCGASTGGFTDVLLKNGAAKVYAVDVGYGQLAWSLRQDGRVVVMERTNARNLVPAMFPEAMDMAVMDLSFISIRLILPAVHALLKPEGQCVSLIKPQFEAGKADVGKKGVVRDRAVHERVLGEMCGFFPTAGYTLMGLDYSPIRGPEGNIEYLAWLKKGAGARVTPDIAALVAASHGELDRQ